MNLLIFTACAFLFAATNASFNIYSPFDQAQNGANDENERYSIESENSIEDQKLQEQSMAWLWQDITDADLQEKSCDACLIAHDDIKPKEIKAKLVRHCDKISTGNTTKNTRTYCHKFMRYLYSNKIPVKSICYRLGLCEKEKFYSIDENQSSNVDLFTDIDYANEGYTEKKLCNSCINMLDVMKDAKTEPKMKNFCNISRVTERENCRIFFAKIYDLIKPVASKVSCQKIEMCSDRVLAGNEEILEEWPNTQVSIQQQTQDGSVCTMCTFFIKLAKDKDYQKMIKKNIDNVCKMLPEPMSEFVKAMADMYLSKWFEIINKDTPEKLCALYGMCENVQINKHLETNSVCEVCDFMIAILSNKSNEKKIKEIVETMTHHLPAPFNDIAKSILIMYLELLFDMIHKGTPEKLCAQYLSCDQLSQVTNGRLAI